MPSASTKVDKQGKQSTGHVFDYIQQIVTIMEKKIRNFEKRKGKLEIYKAELSQGKEFNDDQMAAISKYDEIVHHLDISKELLKQFSNISQEAIIANKKQSKRSQSERHEQELKRLRELLMIQDVLSGMGEEGAREDFLNGVHGAITLTKGNLEALDKLYKLITPSRELEQGGPTYEQQLVSASEHISCLLDGKNKKIMGTSYKEIHKMIVSIHDCGYFNQASNLVTEPVTDVTDGGTDDVCCGVDPPSESHLSDSVPIDANHVAVENQSSEAVHTEPPVVANEVLSVKNSDDKTVFSTFAHHRPYADIISNDCFNFLQESQIELSATQLDPAVVAVHNTVPSSVMPYPGVQRADGLPYPLHLGSEDSLMGGNVNQVNQFVAAQSQQLLPQGDFRQGIPSQTFTNQTFVNLQSFTAAVYGQVPAQTILQPAPSVIDQPIAQEPKKHLMNVNATTFESLSYKQRNCAALLDESLPLCNLDDSLTQNAVEQSLMQQQQQSDSLQFTTVLDSQENISSTGYTHQSNTQMDYSKVNYNNNRSRVSSVRSSGSSASGGGGGGGVGSTGSGRGSMNGYTIRGPSRPPNNNYSNGRTGGGGGSPGGSNYQSYRDYYQHSYSRDSYDGTSNSHNSYNKRGGGGGGGGSMALRGSLRGGASSGGYRGPSNNFSNGGPSRGNSRVGFLRPITTSPP